MSEVFSTHRRRLMRGMAAALALGPAARAFADEGQYLILRAWYGTDEHAADVTQQLRELARRDYRFRVANDSFGVDPDPGRHKVLRIHARGPDGQARIFEYREGDWIDGAVFIGWRGGDWRHEERYDDAGSYRILQAHYGVAGRHVDVTGRLRELAARDQRLRVSNELFGVDPAPGVHKNLRIYARGLDGSVRNFDISEGDVVDGGQFIGWRGGDWGRGGWEGRWEEREERREDRREERAERLRILSAHYGLGYQRVDLTARLQSLLRYGRLDVRVDNELAGADPAPGRHKTLWLRYALDGREYQRELGEGDQLSLP